MALTALCVSEGVLNGWKGAVVSVRARLGSQRRFAFAPLAIKQFITNRLVSVGLGFLALITTTFLLPGEAASHSPRYSHVEELPARGDQKLYLKLWHGDGIFAADPIRAVVTDAKGNIWAISPVSRDLGIFCKNAGGLKDCAVYDRLGSRIFALDPVKWRSSGKLLEAGGKLEDYPEDYRGEEYGFTIRAATSQEIWRAEIRGIMRNPTPTLVGLVWWALFWLMVRPALRSMFRIRGRSRDLGVITPRIAGALAMFFPVAFVWMQAPYGPAYLLVALMISIGAVQLLSGDRKHIARTA